MSDLPIPPAQRPAQRLRLPKTLRTVFALMLREMSTTYGRSAAGYLWAIVEPASGILLLTFIFSLAFRAPELGVNYPLYFASGMLPFMMFQDIAQKVATALRFSRALLFYPGVTFIDAMLARIVLNAMTQVMVSVVVIGGIILMYQIDVLLDFPSLVLGYGMALSLAVGIGTLNCYLMAIYPVWDRVWGIATRPLFIISAIIFLFDSIPLPYRDWLWWNPIIHVVGAVRQGIYATYDAPYISPLYVFSVSLTTLALGLMLLRKQYRDIINM